MSDFQIMMLIIIWVAFAVIVGAVADQRGRDGFVFGLAAMVISPIIALIIVIALPVVAKEDPNKIPCPHCHGLVDHQVECCMHCGREIVWPVPIPKPVPPPFSPKTTEQHSSLECLSCGKIFSYTDADNGIVICPHCQTRNTIKSIVDPPKTTPENFEAECPDCGKTFPIKSNCGIIETLCPHCQSILSLDTVVG